MSIDVIQAEYDKLDDIAGRFAKSAESTADMRSRIEQSVQALQSGKWEGEGSTAFFTEMERDVFPVMTRLAGALEQAQSVTLQAKDILQAAEDEAARPFGASDTVTKERGHAVPALGSVGVTDPDITNSPYYDEAIENEGESPRTGWFKKEESQEHYEWRLKRRIALLEWEGKRRGSGGFDIQNPLNPVIADFLSDFGEWWSGDQEEFMENWDASNGEPPYKS